MRKNTGYVGVDSNQIKMMPQSMIISNGVGGFIQYPQMQTPFFPQMAQVGGMQMILQPTLQLRHVSILRECVCAGCGRNTPLSGVCGRVWLLSTVQAANWHFFPLFCLLHYLLANQKVKSKF